MAENGQILKPRPVKGALHIFSAGAVKVLPFQFMPESISETKGANWAETQIVGRSSPLYTYAGSPSKEITLNLEFFVAPMSGDSASPDDFKKLIYQLQALVYPQEGGSEGEFTLLSPPVVILDLGWWTFRSIVKNVAIDYNLPWSFSDNMPHYIKATLQLSEAEISPLMYDQVLEGAKA